MQENSSFYHSYKAYDIYLLAVIITIKEATMHEAVGNISFVSLTESLHACLITVYQILIVYSSMRNLYI